MEEHSIVHSEPSRPDSVRLLDIPTAAHGWLILSGPNGLPDNDLIEDEEWPDLGPIVDLMMN